MQHTTFTFQSLTRLFTVLFFITLASGAFAQASLSVQGVLTRSDGTAVDDGIYTVTFKLFDAPTGGTEVHSEPIDIETIGGVYSTVLGQNPAYPLTATFNTIYYLSVRVGSSELLPRPKLTHAPYALSLLGQTNQFPSTGRVNADYIVVPGGNPSVGFANAGYSFGTGGDPDGGMFSNDDNNVSFWANATKKIEISNSSVSLYGPTYANDLAVTGNTSVSGWVDAAGVVQAASFTVNPTNTTGMFPNGNSEVILKTDGNNRIWCGSNLAFDNNDHIYANAATSFDFNIGNGGGYVNVNGVMNLQRRIFAPGMLLSGNGGLGVFYDQNSKELTAKTSSRRFKTNIKNFEDDFSLILKAQPKIYTRPESPDPNATEIGYIAEEMDSLGLQQLVIYDIEGNEFSLHYDLVPIYTLEVVKAQDNAIRQLQEEVAALKNENKTLKTENTTLRTDNGNLQAQQAIFSKQLDDISRRMNMLETLKVDNNRK